MRLALAALLLAVAPAPAGAQLRALAPGGAGPVLVGDRFVWGAGEDALRVVSAPAAGGEAVPVGELPAGSELAGAAGGLAAVDEDGGLFTAGPAGPFQPFGGRAVGAPPIDSWIPALQVTAAGVVTLEDDRVMLRQPDGRLREVAIPPGADPTRVAAAGDLAVAPTPEGALTVFHVRTDMELAQISLGQFDPNTITGLAISPEGDVAATVPVGDGDDVLLWAPAGASRVRELKRGDDYGSVAVGAGRVAFVASDGLRDGFRAFVIDPRSRRIVFRGPPALDVSRLSFDGRTIAFALPNCLIAGSPVSRRTIPPGPCARTDLAVDSPSLRDGSVSFRVACINAPARRCRVIARVTTRSGRLVGRLDKGVPLGRARVLSIRVKRPSARLRLTVRAVEPANGGR
ncbi:MAG TPA: hypothetical protein VFZ00_18515 [Solirubrobacter sp.]|nr:hypothetical protein [Solirubrobacter sp.]